MWRSWTRNRTILFFLSAVLTCLLLPSLAGAQEIETTQAVSAPDVAPAPAPEPAQISDGPDPVTIIVDDPDPISIFGFPWLELCGKLPGPLQPPSCVIIDDGAPF